MNDTRQQQRDMRIDENVHHGYLSFEMDSSYTINLHSLLEKTNRWLVCVSIEPRLIALGKVTQYE